MSEVAHNYKPDVDLKDAANTELERLKALMKIEEQPDGEYYITDISMRDYGNNRLMLMHRIYNMLVAAYPGYQWSQSEALNPTVRGMTIRWRKK